MNISLLWKIGSGYFGRLVKYILNLQSRKCINTQNIRFHPNSLVSSETDNVLQNGILKETKKSLPLSDNLLSALCNCVLLHLKFLPIFIFPLKQPSIMILLLFGLFGLLAFDIIPMSDALLSIPS